MSTWEGKPKNKSFNGRSKISPLNFAELAIKTCQKLGADETEAFIQNQQIVEVVLERAEKSKMNASKPKVVLAYAS